MKFDGSSVSLNDVMHDIVFGAGTVTNVNEAEHRITVSFGERQYTYNAGGVGHFPQKTLFWQDPIKGYTPMKDNSKWEHFCELRKSLAQVVWASKHVRNGE